MICKDGEDYYVVANGCMLIPFAINPERPDYDYLLAMEGCFEEGRWVSTRRLNGDETAFMNFDGYRLLRFRFFTYA